MILSKLTSTAVKTMPGAAAVSLPSQLVDSFDPLTALAIALGLVAGAMWRAGDQRGKGETWDKIRNDLLVSALTGMANFIVSAIAVNIAGVPPLYALGIATVVAAKGPDALVWFRQKFFGDGPPLDR